MTFLWGSPSALTPWEWSNLNVSFAYRFFNPTLTRTTQKEQSYLGNNNGNSSEHSAYHFLLKSFLVFRIVQSPAWAVQQLRSLFKGQQKKKKRVAFFSFLNFAMASLNHVSSWSLFRALQSWTPEHWYLALTWNLLTRGATVSGCPGAVGGSAPRHRIGCRWRSDGSLPGSPNRRCSARSIGVWCSEHFAEELRWTLRPGNLELSLGRREGRKTLSAARLRFSTLCSDYSSHISIVNDFTKPTYR